MRIIQLDNLRSIELWPGRRLAIEDGDGLALYALPKGAMSQHGRTLSFGAGRSAVQLVGAASMIKTIAKTVLEIERPVAGVTVILS